MAALSSLESVVATGAGAGGVDGEAWGEETGAGLLAAVEPVVSTQPELTGVASLEDAV
jgi:hypothetical protein